MSNNQYLEKEFFIIDSNNLNDIQEKLYGYVFQDNKFLFNASELNIEETPLDGNGTYIYIKRKNNEIKIYQDFNGSYGLYLYRENDYFAISNSFMRLVDYIKKDHKISFNKDYADVFLSSGTCPRTYAETLINEIVCIDRNKILTIDIDTKKITYEYIDYKERSIELTSQEGMEILDKWYLKYVNLIRDLYKNGENIRLDLSGGFDTRMTSVLFIGANVDLNRIYVFSEHSDEYTFAEDYKIATEIANHYNFILNQKDTLDFNVKNYTEEEIFNSCYSVIMGFHTRMRCATTCKTPYVYVFKGVGGENVRSYYRMSKERFINIQARKARQKYNDENIENNIRNILERTYTLIQEKYDNINRPMDLDSISANLFKETYSSKHFGKWSVIYYLLGDISPNPLLDTELAKLKLGDKDCDDFNLLMAIILTRYVKDLLSFEFNNNQFIELSTIEYAKQINEKYPFIKPDWEFLTRNNPENPEIKNYNESMTRQHLLDDLFEKSFYSSKLKRAFETYYGENVYDIIRSHLQNNEKNAILTVNVAVAIGKIIEDVLANETMRNKTGYDFAKNELQYFSESNKFVLPIEQPVKPKDTIKKTETVKAAALKDKTKETKKAVKKVKKIKYKKLSPMEKVFSVTNIYRNNKKRKRIMMLGFKITV